MYLPRTVNLDETGAYGATDVCRVVRSSRLRMTLMPDERTPGAATPCLRQHDESKYREAWRQDDIERSPGIDRLILNVILLPERKLSTLSGSASFWLSACRRGSSSDPEHRGVPSSLASSPALYQPSAEHPGERLREVLGIGLPGQNRTAGTSLNTDVPLTAPDGPALGRVEGRRLLSMLTLPWPQESNATRSH
ncbi:hypothetical protein B0H65DRAFT_577990 [Neurospora tetraspora]|uniref:Uncharacterized protein n=1 Tax=Neurospora tetraspora TaxID=94610 RepID=A0AAE0JAC8_9PEZI|nr:hypothetical protein B0H65DRAFT_577990 [Neurospora tetraspora]